MPTPRIFNFGNFLFNTAITQGLEAGSDECSSGDCYCHIWYGDPDPDAPPVYFDPDLYCEDDFDLEWSEVHEDRAAGHDIRCGICRHSATIAYTDPIFEALRKPTDYTFTLVMQYADGDHFIGPVTIDDDCINCAIAYAREEMGDIDASLIAAFPGFHTTIHPEPEVT